MRRLILILALMVGLPLIGAAQATHISTSGTLPANCRVGDVYYKTGSSAGVYSCTATNTWTILTAGATGGGSATIAGVILTPQGRLTLTSGTPWLISTVTAATTVYYTPAVGSFVPIYDGSVWTATSFAEMSQATTDSTKSPAAVGTYSNYDVFVWSDTGTLRATRGPAWTQAQTFTVTIASPAVFSLTGHGFYECEPIVLSTTGALPTGLSAGTTYFIIATGLTANAFEVATSCGGSAVNTTGTQSGTHTATQNTTVRGSGAGTTELEFVNGVLMNKNAITNGPGADRGTYVGTVRTNGLSQVDFIVGGAGAAGGESTTLGLWNMYNRRLITLVNFDNTNTWNYTLQTFRVKDGNVNNRIQFTTGWQGDWFQAANNIVARNSSINVSVIGGIGSDGMVAMVAGSSFGQNSVGAVSANFSAHGFYDAPLPLGTHYLSPLEWSVASGTSTWVGDDGGSNGGSIFKMVTSF